MKSFFVFAGFIAYIPFTYATPSRVLQERDGPADPPGSVLPSPATAPSYAPTASLAPDVTFSSKFSWQIYKSCPDSNKAAITQAWADSKELSDALGSYKLEADFQPAMDMYMGTRSTYQNYFRDPPWDFPRQIYRTIKKHQGLYQGKSESGNANLWVYCNEDSFWFGHCTKGDNPPWAIIAYETEDRFFNNWYITFCPQFYNATWTIPFQQKKKELQNSNPSPGVMEFYREPMTQGYAFFHETFHMSQLVTSPKAWDSAYGAQDCYDLAKNKNTDSAVYNADSWSLVGLAIWAQQTFNLRDPPMPGKYATPALIQPDALYGVDPDVIYIDSAGVVPQGASPVPAGHDYFVNTTLWDVQDPAGAPAPSQSSSAPAPAPYTPGTCSFHLKESWLCTTDDKNLYAVINMKDGAQKDIGDTDTSQSPAGSGINAGASYSFNSKLPHPLVVTGEHTGDYVQFNYGGLAWTTAPDGGKGGASCKVGGWDPQQGPVCGRSGNVQPSLKNMDCSFPC